MLTIEFMEVIIQFIYIYTFINKDYYYTELPAAKGLINVIVSSLFT